MLYQDYSYLKGPWQRSANSLNQVSMWERATSCLQRQPSTKLDNHQCAYRFRRVNMSSD